MHESARWLSIHVPQSWGPMKAGENSSRCTGILPGGYDGLTLVSFSHAGWHSVCWGARARLPSRGLTGLAVRQVRAAAHLKTARVKGSQGHLARTASSCLGKEGDSPCARDSGTAFNFKNLFLTMKKTSQVGKLSGRLWKFQCIKYYFKSHYKFKTYNNFSLGSTNQ